MIENVTRREMTGHASFLNTHAATSSTPKALHDNDGLCVGASAVMFALFVAINPNVHTTCKESNIVFALAGHVEPVVLSTTGLSFDHSFIASVKNEVTFTEVAHCIRKRKR